MTWSVCNLAPSDGDSTAAPVSPYAATKRAAELMAHAFWHMSGVPVTVARIFTVYGPRGRPDMAVYRQGLILVPCLHAENSI